MILLYAILLGLTAGLARAWLTGRDLRFPDLGLLWLAPIAYLPQYLAFNYLPTRALISDHLAAFILVETQLLLLGFVWVNRQRPGFWLLGLGLSLNLLVIAFNGGFMPISPETVARLAPEAPPGAWSIGERLGTTKDIVLPASMIRLDLLSDHFLMEVGFSGNRVAFSLGDVVIALGTFWLFWSMGSRGSVLRPQPLRTSTKRFALGYWQPE